MAHMIKECEEHNWPLRRYHGKCPKTEEALHRKKEEIWAKTCPETSKKGFIGKERKYSSTDIQVKPLQLRAWEHILPRFFLLFLSPNQSTNSIIFSKFLQNWKFEIWVSYHT